MKKGFTLAEIMIALVVIGVITSILLPVAFNNVPNENIMKFKKGNATLAKVINELVTSGEYYTPGDLGIKADGTLINGDHTDDYGYFCKSFADMINTKTINCTDKKIQTDLDGSIVCSDWDVMDVNPQGRQTKAVDDFCKTFPNPNSEIINSDGIVYYETFAYPTFGWDKYGYFPANGRLFLEPVGFSNKNLPEDKKMNEIDSAYRCKKVFCMDVDGIDKGEDPFGYGIRVDGKIILGKRAQEWLEKSLQEK